MSLRPPPLIAVLKMIVGDRMGIMNDRAILLLLFMFANVCMAQSLCFLVTIDDATSFYGSKPDSRTDQPDVCTYLWKDQRITLTVVNYIKSPSAKDRFNGSREGLKAARVSVRDEVGLGAEAFSASQINSIDIFLLKGNATVQITVNNAWGRALPLAFRDKLREVAMKTAARI